MFEISFACLAFKIARICDEMANDFRSFSEDKNFLAGLNVCKGQITYKAVADAFGHEFVEPSNVI